MIYEYSHDIFDEFGHVFWQESDAEGVLEAPKTRPLMVARREKLPVMGVELETGSDEDNAEEIAESLHEYTDFSEFGICKEDSTVSGPELVTLPATLAAHRKVYSWQEWCNTVRDSGGYGYSSYTSSIGMHVHLNRPSVSKLETGKLLRLLNRQSNGQGKIWATLAQRENNSYARPTKMKVTDIEGNGERYSVINVTHRTLEFRLFRSSLKAERILKNIEIVHSARAFVREQSILHCNAHSYLYWLIQGPQQKAYPMLYEFIQDRLPIEFAAYNSQEQVNLDFCEGIAEKYAFMRQKLHQDETTERDTRLSNASIPNIRGDI